MNKISLLIIILSICETLSAQKNNGLNISQTKSQYLVNDTIPKVVYPQKWETNENLVLLNEKPTTFQTLSTINPEHIKSIRIEKEKFRFNDKEYNAKIFVETKPEFNTNLITINELILKYTNLKKDENFIYSIDGEILNADEKNTFVDEKYIMQIKVVKLDKIDNPKNLNFIKILTRSQQNLNKANEIIIRGKDLTMND